MPDHPASPSHAPGLALGQEAVLERPCSAADLTLFAHATAHAEPRPGQAEPVATAWGLALMLAAAARLLPGQAPRLAAFSLASHRPPQPGEQIRAEARVTSLTPGERVGLACRLQGAGGLLLAEGSLELLLPAAAPAPPGPAEAAGLGWKFARLLAACEGVPPLPTAVVAPTDDLSLGGACEAARARLIEPLLIGPAAAIRAVAEQIGWDLSDATLIEEADAHAAARRAVALVQQGQAAAIMKGAIHTDALLRQVTRPESGLREGRRLSHVFVLDVPGREGLMLISDAAINIAPDLAAKADIVQNAIDLARAIGIAEPRVGILSAVETVNPDIPSTLDAAALSKMAERGQIRGGLVDGPLAMDNAVDVAAARTKGLSSVVAGHADVLIAPNLEAGNMLAKQLVFLSGADTGGLVVGARVPIMLTSRADDAAARLASAALAVLYRHWRISGRSLLSEAPAAP
ncbi:MAG: bifunctional enoyl-CoA hydratase/phosphate acetyltransferase [Rhodovarius sp.]|nr:bifunctional enoyl-CoA hydratase/phosphate acetyltransferase [Rhodovarius sp.]